MRLSSAIAIYFIIWWCVLFAVLPWGIRNASEAGETVEQGNDAGAPINPRLGLKALITTIVASVVFALVYAIITQGWITLDDFSLVNGPKV
jgi:predicted secreted protein